MISEGIAVGVTGAICSAVVAYFKFRKPSSNGNGQADLAEQRTQAIATARATLQATPPGKPPGGPDE